MPTSIISVSFTSGFVGNNNGTTAAQNSVYLASLGWSNMQFQQVSSTGMFGAQGNDVPGTILITDAAGVQHRIDGVINWRAPSGTATTMVFYATGSHTLAKTGGGTYFIDPWTEVNSDPRTYIGLTFNGQSLAINNGAVSGNAASLLTLLNTYLADQPKLAVSDITVNEGAGTATVTVTLTPPSSGSSSDTVTVRYATVDGSAAAGRDYTAVSGTLTFAPGQTSQTITVPVTDTVAIDGARALSVVLSDSTFAAITDNTGVVTINDNDSVVVPVAATVASVVAEDGAHPGLDPVDSTVTEGGTLVYSVILNGTGGEHSLALGGTATDADRGSLSFSDGVAWKNGDPASGIVVVPAGVGSFKVTLTTIDDTVIEQAETAVLTVGGKAATGTITDNDSQAVSAVKAEDAAHTGLPLADDSVVEGSSLLYTVTLNGASPVATEYTLALSGSASTADLGAITFSNGVIWKNGNSASSIVVVPAGVGSFKVTLPTIDDTVIEQAETAVLTVGGVSATGTITDNDSQAITSVIAEDAAHTGATAVDSAVIEGATLVYTVALNGASPVPVEYALGIGGNAAGTDFGAFVFSTGAGWKNGNSATGIVVVQPGVTGFTITVPTVDDVLVETAESLVLTVGGVAAAGTITDNDSRSITAIVAGDAANPSTDAVEEGHTLRYTVSVNSAGVANTEYALVVSGSATDADLGAIAFSNGVTWKGGDPATGIVVVPVGVTGFTIDVATIDDTAVEPSETVTVALGGIVATGTVTDNDAPIVSTVTASTAAQPSSGTGTVTEGAALAYAVTLDTAGLAPVEFTLVLGGAASPADLGSLSFSNGVAWKNGDPGTDTVVVPAGVVAFTVTLPTIDDTAVENAESAVVAVGGVAATGTIVDNDVAVPPPVVPETPTTPTTPTTPVLQTGLDPASDDGSSQTDTVTSVITPEFTINAGSLLPSGGSVRLLSPTGDVVGTSAITAEDIASGKINVGAGLLDDGVYTFNAQVLDANGNVVAQAPVSVTIVTDVDGVMPSVELAAHGGDFNHDGVLDWQQHTVAQMPMRSLADFVLGKDASAASFGAVLAGSVTNAGEAVQLTAGAQLKDLSLTDLPAALPQGFRATSPVFNFTVTAEDGVASLPDLDAGRDGLQTRVVIDLAAGGSLATDFLKFDSATQSYYSFLDDGRLDTMDNGATLVDLNADGRVDRIVLTLTDGGWGDEDGLVNGTIVDPGMLAFDTPDNQVYSILLAGGDRYYTASAAEAAQKAAVAGNTFEGVAFDAQPGGQQMAAYYQPFTQDYTFAAAGQALPYACYGAVDGAGGFTAAAAGSGTGTDFHLYQNAQGATQLVTVAEAASLDLAARGYTDRGAKFAATTTHAFDFDAEGYLLANQDNASVQALVQQLAATYQSSSAAGFVDAVEQNYLAQVTIVGVAHGAAATAAELNAAFGTAFAG